MPIPGPGFTPIRNIRARLREIALVAMRRCHQLGRGKKETGFSCSLSFALTVGMYTLDCMYVCTSHAYESLV